MSTAKLLLLWYHVGIPAEMGGESKDICPVVLAAIGALANVTITPINVPEKHFAGEFSINDSSVLSFLVLRHVFANSSFCSGKCDQLLFTSYNIALSKWGSFTLRYTYIETSEPPSNFTHPGDGYQPLALLQTIETVVHYGKKLLHWLLGTALIMALHTAVSYLSTHLASR